MKKLFNYIPSITICFTLVILFCSITNLINGFSSMSNMGILAIFILIILLCGVSTLLSYIDFKSNKTYTLCNFGVTYCCFLLFNFLFNFSQLTLKNVIVQFLAFSLIYYLGYIYLIKKSKLEADEINKKISKS